MRFSTLTTRCVVALVVVSANLYSQEARSVFFNHKLSPQKVSFSHTSSALPETVRVLAAMVEFLPDADPLTTGNGLFDTSTTAGQIIDPPPHDKAYFENHLLFLHNYWKKVSNGTIIVVSAVVDTVIRLSREMRFYSPPTNSTTNRELAQLVHDTWKKVDSVRTINFSQYDAFCIFHAGVGRDIDLTSIFGFDPTPFDIPSLYLDSLALRQALPDSSFLVSNSMILPETESRLLPAAGGEFLLQLGINGLLAASFGSYLGLPDLFDTRTGRSGIGRFGLMDGESIFSWAGVFPPEPSAWEKYFLDRKYNLGMLHIIDAPSDSSQQSLPAVSLASTGQDTILRVPISAKEYFLVENRNRDAGRDGATVTRIFNGATIQQTFQRDTTGFHAFDQDSLYGVLIDVDEFDFSLPGGVSQTGEFFDGGILVWHVDENTIDAGYATNSVNAEPRRRGVDLEEADGSQDIGQPYGFLDPGDGSQSGTALDFWFSDNIAPVYRNEFSHTSHPNSISNAGANSHVTLKGFTPRGHDMTVTVERGDNVAKPVPGYPRFIGRSTTDASPQFHKALFVSVGDSIFAFRSDIALSATDSATGLFSTVGGRHPVAINQLIGDTLLIVVGAQDSLLYAWSSVYRNQDSTFGILAVDSLNLQSNISTSPVIRKYDRGPLLVTEILVGDEEGTIHRAALGLADTFDISIGTTAVQSLALFYPGGVLPQANPEWIATTSTAVASESRGSFTLPYSSSGWQVVTAENRIIVADMGGSMLLLLDENFGVVKQFTGRSLSLLAVADIDGDGKRDVVFGSGDRLYVMNQAGAMVDHFPVTLAAPVSGSPIVARLTGETSVAHILVTTTNGLVAAYSSKGKLLPGFPLAIAGANISTPTLFSVPTGAGSTESPLLFVVDTAGFMSGWRLTDIPSALVAPWGSYRGNVSHNATDTTALFAISPAADFLPTSRAYNWPNPVYDGKTFIRYFVKDNATVQIKVYDMAGELVAELGGPGVGGFDNEVEWNVGNIQSGVYFGRIEAEAGGQRGVAIIKIAVVK